MEQDAKTIVKAKKEIDAMLFDMEDPRENKESMEIIQTDATLRMVKIIDDNRPWSMNKEESKTIMDSLKNPQVLNRKLYRLFEKVVERKEKQQDEQANKSKKD